ncbi:unnamed protein product [Lactuca saligna]|uniref:Uncharacterized protein n=1 Tax=Lactuca saligna TaxID=75948 RepID=A0AA35ZXC6_LACSI|nr:unnamed protein product [Lactuca saligna]
MKDSLENEYIDYDSLVDMRCTYEVVFSQLKANNEKGDEVINAMDAIIQGTDEKSQSKNVHNPKPEFIEGNASDVLSKIVKLNLESFVDLLEA